MGPEVMGGKSDVPFVRSRCFCSKSEVISPINPSMSKLEKSTAYGPVPGTGEPAGSGLSWTLGVCDKCDRRRRRCSSGRSTVSKKFGSGRPGAAGWVAGSGGNDGVVLGVLLVVVAEEARGGWLRRGRLPGMMFL